MIGSVGAHRERQTVAIHYRHDFHAFSAPRRANLDTATLRRRERGIDEALRLINLAFITQRVGQIREYFAQRLFAAPLLEAPMHGLVVRIPLRKHVPLSACVEYPQRGLQHAACWNGFTTGTSVRNIFLRKVLADSLPLLIAQFQHARNFTALNAATK